MRSLRIALAAALCLAAQVVRAQDVPAGLGVQSASRIVCTDAYGVPGEAVPLTARLLSSDGTTPIPGQPIVFASRGRELPGSPVLTDQDGLACLPYHLPARMGKDPLAYVATFVGSPTVGGGKGEALLRYRDSTKVHITVPGRCGANTLVTVKVHLASLMLGCAIPHEGVTLYTDSGWSARAETDDRGDAYFRWPVPDRPTSGQAELDAESGYGRNRMRGVGSATVEVTRTETAGIAVLNMGAGPGHFAGLAKLTKVFRRTPVVGAKVQLYIDGVLVAEPVTDGNGLGLISIALPSGPHDAVCSYDGDVNVTSASASFRLTVR